MYLKVVLKKLLQVFEILDRYHLVANLNKVLDEVIFEGTRELKVGAQIL